MIEESVEITRYSIREWENHKVPFICRVLGILDKL